MTTNEGHEALSAYIAVIQAIVGCVSKAVCFTYPVEGGKQILAWGEDGFLRVQRTDNTYLYIDINQQVSNPLPDNKESVSTTYYLYTIADKDQTDLFSFHYHPELNDDPIEYAHIHAYADQDKRFVDLNLQKRHVPSGRVALEDVVHWLIDELKVKPLRDDWKQILSDAKKTFKETQTWW